MTQRHVDPHFSWAALGLILVAIWQSAEQVKASPLGTDFTYQGYIEDAGSPANGIYDLEFNIYDAPDTTTAVLLGTDRHCALEVSKGLFSTSVDFGDIYDGTALWLEIGIAPAGDCDDLTAFEYLAPAQALTATPYALFALEGNRGEQGEPGEPGQDGQDGEPGPPGASPFGLNGPDAFYVDGNVGIGTMIPSALLEVADGGVLFSGTDGLGVIPREGAGVRLMWHPAKAALRAGQVTLDQWDDAKVGQMSVGLGLNTTASGAVSIALGHAAKALATDSVALGRNTTASGDQSTALGQGTQAMGSGSTAMGVATTAIGQASTALGFFTRASQVNSTAMGTGTAAEGEQAVAMGQNTLASGKNSLALGFETEARAFGSLAMGRFNEPGGSPNSWHEQDPLISIGVGEDDANRKSALTMLKNGNLGLGTTDPQHSLDVRGDIRSTGTICDGQGCIGDSASSGPSSVVIQGFRASEAASGLQILSHSLGAVPSRAEITAVAGLREAAMTSIGYSDGSMNACSFIAGENHAAGNSGDSAIHIRYNKSGSSISVSQEATVSFDGNALFIDWESGGVSSFVDDFTIAFTIRLWS